MSALFRHRATAVWCALIGATGLSWLLGGSHGQLATAAALAIAFVKVRYVGLEFMELRVVARPLRAAFEAWLLLVGGTVLALFLAA